MAETNITTPSETQIHPDVKITNSFAPLEQVMDLDAPSTSAGPPNINNPVPTSPSTTTIKRQPRMPPIIVKKLPEGNIFNHNRKLQAILTQPLKISYSVDGMKYHTGNRADYDKLYTILQAENIPFFSHEPRATKALNIVIKGLPVKVEANDLKQELEHLHYTIEHVRQITVADAAPDGTLFRRPVPIWVVTLPNTEESRQIYNLKDINQHTLRVESYKPNPRVTQCHRCQEFGHTSRRCNLKVQCVKCGQDHLFANCPQKGPAHNPKCANCGSQYTASYGKCPIQIQQREALQQKIRNRTTERPPTTSRLPWHPAEFPPLPRSENLPPTTQPETLTSTIKEIFTLLKEINITHLISVAKTTLQRLRGANDLFSKGLILLEAFTTFTTTTNNGP